MKRLFIFLLIIFVFILFLGGCGDDSDDSGSDGDSGANDDDDNDIEDDCTLTIIDGNLQSGFVGTELFAPLRVRVADSDGTGIPGIEISFELMTGETEGKGTVVPASESALTDSDGQAQVSAAFGETPGMARVRAFSPIGRFRPVMFNLSAYAQPTDSKKPICFLSINDFHSHALKWGHDEDLQGGLGRLVRTFKTIRENNDKIGVPTVILNAGDDTENTIFHDIPGFLPWLVEQWDKAGMDVWQVGNHDYHFGIPFLTDFVEQAAANFTPGQKGHPMRITFGNVDPSTLRNDLSDYAELFETDFGDPAHESFYEQTTIIQAGDVKVGILGVVTDAAVYTQVPGDPFFLKMMDAANPDRELLTFFDPDPRESDYINDGIDALIDEGADLVVVLSHCGFGFVDRVNLPPGKDNLISTYGMGPVSGRGIDLLIGGHSHLQLNVPVVVDNVAGGKTPIVQALEGGLFIARVDAVADVENGGFSFFDSRLIQVNSNLPEDPEIEQEAMLFLNNDLGFDSQWFEKELCETPIWLSHRAMTTSGLGNVINDAFLWKLDQQGFDVNGSVVIPSLYRIDLWPGMITAGEAFDVVPLHKMDEQGTNSDTLALLTFRPGLMDASTLLMPGTWKGHTTALEYLLELIHTLPDLAEIIPPLGKELKIEVFQMAGVSYEADLTAKAYHHVVPGSVTIGGLPADPTKIYRVAMVETLATTLSYALNTLIVGHVDGEGYVKPLINDPETGLPYTDTQIPLWRALEDYLAQVPDDALPEANITVMGDVLKTVQPDLVINPSEIRVTESYQGADATIAIRVRNTGLEPVKSATLKLFADQTPWDKTDQNDGNAGFEGLPPNYLGSMVLIAEQEISLGGYPDYLDLEFSWKVPPTWPKGLYTLHPKMVNVVGEHKDKNTKQPYTDPYPDNDSGEQTMSYFRIE